MKTQTVSIVPLVLALAALGLNLSVIHHAKADGFVSVRPTNKGRAGHTATLLPNGKVLVAGTRHAGAGTATSAELYDPATDRWTLTGSMRSSIGYNYHTATLLPNGKVLIAGGGSGVVATAELYNPATGTWTLTGALKTPRQSHEATLLPNGKVLVTGGRSEANGGLPLSGCELYDSASGTWTATGSPSTYYPDSATFTATLLPNGKVLVVGGTGAELYDPATGTWTVTGAPGSGQYTATLLHNGKVLAAGGAGTVPAALYDPDSGTWSATGSPTWGHAVGTATLLRNGQVLVAGGIHAGSILAPSAELYDSAAGTWTEIPMIGVRYLHTATLLPNGKVLVAGGWDLRNINLSTAEIYEPDSDGTTPSISILHNANHIMSFSWTGAGTLEQSGSLTGANWQPAPIQDNPLTIAITGRMRFFRLRFNQ